MAVDAEGGKRDVRRRVANGARRRATILLGVLLILAAVPFGRDWFQARAVLAENGLTVTKTADGNPLIGGLLTYTVTVTNTSFPSGPNNPDGKAYNLNIVDQLPPNVRFVSVENAAAVGSPTLTYTGTAPSIRQTMTFINITDLARNQTYTFTYTTTLAPQPAATPPSLGVITPGTVLDNSASVQVSNDPRAASTISAGSATARTTALPFKLTKKTVQSTGVGQDTGGCPAQGTGAGRGFTYALTATNNSIGQSTNMVVVDTLPYGVDYCGTSGGATPTATRNADGTTTLTYTLGALAAGQSVVLTPSVAIPYLYPAGAPITNPLAGKVIADATVFTNAASMTGTYGGTTYDTGPQQSSVTGKYATIAKEGTPSEVAYGTIVNYTLTPSTSTNYNASAVYIVDTLPDGQDYNSGSSQIGGTAFPPTAIPTTVYAPCAGSTSPAAGIYLCPDGTTVLTYGPINNTALTPTTAGTQFTIGFTATVRATYRGTGAPVLATDKLSNGVAITYNADSIAGLSPVTSVQRNGGGAIDSATTASQTTRPPSLVKQIAAVTRGDGSVPPANEARVAPGGKTALAAVGDLVTFRLIYTGSPDADQKNIVLSDFLPAGYRYVAGSSRYSGTYAGTVNGAAQSANPDPSCLASPCPTGGLLIYNLNGTGGNNIVGRGQTLAIELQAQITTGTVGTVGDNLGKFSGVNTAGAAYSGRDQATVTLLAPNLGITKTNTAPNPSLGNQTFNYTVTIRNNGDSTAYRVANLVDTLPADVQYLSTVSITPAGGAASPGANAPTYTPSGTGFGGTLTFTGLSDLPPNATITIVYQAKLSPAPAAGSTATNTARIASYSSQPTGAVATTGAAVQAASNVRIGGQSLTKTAAVVTPQVNGTGGRLTIGDRVDYTVTYTIPANVTVTNGEIRDCLPTGFHYVPGSYSGAVSGGTLPGFPTTEGPGFSSANGTSPCAATREYLRITTGSVTNTGTAITVTVTLRAAITGKNQAGANVFTNPAAANAADTNNAYFFNNTTQIATTTSPSLNIYIPNLALAKTRFSPASPSAGGVTVDFLIRLTNGGQSPAYEIANFVDTLDAGLTFVDAYRSDANCARTTPITPISVVGQTVVLPSPGTLANGANSYICLRATLANGASPSTTYTNTVALGTGGAQYASAPATNPDRRDFSGVGPAQAAITTTALAVSKSVISGRPSANGEAVPGEIISFPLQFAIPAGTTLYNPVITDNFDFSAGGARLGLPTDTTPGATPGGGTVACTGGVSGSYTFAVTGGRATYTFAGNLANTGATASTCVLQLDTRVLNLTGAGGNNAGGTITNSFTVRSKTSTGADAAPVESLYANVAIREPNVTLAKSVVASYDAATGRATFRLILTNAAAPVGTAYNLTVTDTLPAGLAYVSNTAPTSGTGVSNPTAGASGNTITFTVDSLAPGASTSVDVVVRGDGTAGAGRVLTNTANLTYYDLPATINGNNTQTDPNSRRAYTRSDSAAITPPAPTFTKTPATQTITIGGDVTFALTVSVPAGTALYGVTIGDTLPVGLTMQALTYSGATPATCAAPSQTPAAGAGPLSFGTIANASGNACAYTVAVTARSDGSVPAVGVGSATVTNTGTLVYSTTSGGATTTVQATAAVTIQAPVLTFSKSVSPTGPVAIGAVLTYTLTFANSGPVAATNVQISDTYAAGTTVVAGSISNGGTDTPANRTVTFNIGTIAAGASGLTRTFQVNVNALPTDGTIANAATLSTTERPPLTSSATNGTTNLVVTKAVAPGGDVQPGATLTYTLTATNPAPATSAATGVTLRDPIPVNTTYVDNSATNGGSLSGGVINWPAFDVAPGATISRSFQVTVNSPLTNGTQIGNSAIYTSTQTPSDNGTPPVTTPVTSAPVLALTKTVNPTGSLGVGGQAVYTLTIKNTGNEHAENLTLDDVVPAGTTFVAASGAATYTASDRTVRWAIGTVAAGGEATVTLTVAVDSDPASGQLPAGLTIANKGTFSYTNGAGGNSGTGASGTVTNATLSQSLTKTNNPPEATAIAPGAEITYTIIYRNTGTGDLNNVVISDLVPANTTFVSADNGGGQSGDTVTWNLGTVSAGQSRTLSFVARATTPLPNNTVIENRAAANAGGAASGAVPEVVSETVRNRITSAPVFTIAKVNSPTTPVRAGNLLTYTLTVGNTGNENASNITVVDPIPNGTTYIDGSATGGASVQLTGATLTWTIGSLPAGLTTALTFQVVVNTDLPVDGAGTPIDITNSARVTGSTETGMLATPIVSTPVSNPTVGLRVAKSATPADGTLVYYGGTITYGITYRNTGSLPLTNVAVVDDIPAGTTFLEAGNGGSFTGGAGAYGRGRVTWALGTLAAGQEGTLTLRVKVDDPTDPASLTIVNAATVSASELPAAVITNQTTNPTDPPPPTPSPSPSPTPSPTPSASPTPMPSASPTPRPTPAPTPSASPTPTPTPSPSVGPEQPTVPAEVDLVVTKTGPSSAALGETITYTITIINRGPGNAYRAQFTDNVPSAISTVTWQCVSVGQAACGLAGGSGNAISLPVTLNAGTDNRITITVTGLVAAPGTVTNTARVDPPGGSTERVPDDNTSGVVTTIAGPGAPSPIPTPNPTPGPGASPVPSASPAPRPSPPSGIRRPDIQKIADVLTATAGQRVVFTITVMNPGSEPATSMVIVDQVPPEFAVQSASTTRGTATVEGQGVTVTVGTLGPGETVTITIATIATGSGQGTIVNTASYTATIGDQGVNGRAMAGVGVPALPNTGGGGMAGTPPRWPIVAFVAALASFALMGRARGRTTPPRHLRDGGHDA